MKNVLCSEYEEGLYDQDVPANDAHAERQDGALQGERLHL